MPQDLEQQFITFYADHRQGRLSRAEKGYQSLLAAKPDWGPVLAALGNLYLDRDTPEKARPVLEKAAALDPPDLSACYSLGRLKQLENDHQGAIPLYRKILDRKPGSGLVWNNLGVAFRETGRPEKAMAGFESAVRLAPELAEAWNNLGVAQDEQRLAKKARKSYQTAIDLQPDYISPHLNLGILHQKAGRFKAAEAHYDRVLKIQPDHEIAIFMRQSIRGEETPDAAPVEHVRSIFNQCADNFETILVRDLKYRTPELLFNLVRPWLTRDMTILDLGCGTGLGAQLYRPFSRHLSGVDVSENMLKKAWEKKIYDHLELFDVLQELSCKFAWHGFFFTKIIKE